MFPDRLRLSALTELETAFGWLSQAPTHSTADCSCRWQRWLSWRTWLCRIIQRVPAWSSFSLSFVARHRPMWTNGPAWRALCSQAQ